MLRRYKIPKTIMWVINLFLIFLLIFTLFRFATYFAFKPRNFSFVDLLPSFLMGIQYDLRWIAIIILPVVVISMFPQFSPFYSSRNKKWWTWYLAIITFIVFFFFAADFGSFSYNRTRLDAGAMNFAEDFNTSFRMMWQTYPMIWLILGFLAGYIAKLIMPGPDGGVVLTTILGIVGAVVGGFIGTFFGYARISSFDNIGGSLPSFVFSVLGAIVVLAIFRLVQGRRL